MAVSTLLVLLLASALTVRGQTGCPTPAEVTGALEALVPSAAAQPSEEVGEIVADGDGIRVRLVDGAGAVLAEKRLPAAGCGQMAETAAVVLAAWASEFHPELALGFELPPPPPPAAPRPPPAPPATLSASMSAAAASPAWVAAAGANVLASLDGNTMAPAAAVEARLYRRRSGWGGRVALSAIGTHRLAIGPGQATWRRLSVSVGLLRRVVSSRLFAEGSFDVVSGLLAVEGAGYTVGDSDRSLDAGAELGARAGLKLGQFEPYVGAALAGWLRPQTVDVSGIQGRHALPSAEARLGVGITVVWDP
jgi:hypothetical protein